MSEFIPEDPGVAAFQERLREAWQEDPASTAAGIAGVAAAQQFQTLKPVIDEVLESQRGQLQRANADEAVAAMEATYGDSWVPYKDAVTAYVEANPDLISDDVAADPQKLAERLQGIYRAVKPQVDAERRTGEWERIQMSYREYGDPIKGRDFE